MGSLEDFEVQVKDLITKFSLNISVSGVALIVDEASEKLYSASLVVEKEGLFPFPSKDDILTVFTELQRLPLCDFTMRRVQYVEALCKDTKLLRWQAQYCADGQEH